MSIIKEYPLVSIVIVNYNGKAFLPPCLSSLRSLNYPAGKIEIILVDNCSADESVSLVRNNYPEVQIVQLDSNYGFCKPNNEGAKRSTGEYLVFLNNDTEVTKEWLSELVKPALESPGVICCASRMLYDDRRETINTAGGKITIIGGGYYRGYGEKNSSKFDRLENVSFGCGAGVLVKRDFFLSIGGFDEDYFASGEEYDLGWKVWLYGFKVVYAPQALMYHKESGTFGSRSTFDPYKVYLGTRNRLYNMLKNLETTSLMRASFISLIFNTYRWGRYLFSGNFKSANAVCRAHIDFFRDWSKTLEKRKSVLEKRVRKDSELYKLGVIATLSESFAEERRLGKIWRDSYFE
jgi:GT2 family glycosyltransferase